jgi:hypothetical protein
LWKCLWLSLIHELPRDRPAVRAIRKLHISSSGRYGMPTCQTLSNLYEPAARNFVFRFGLQKNI